MLKKQLLMAESFLKRRLHRGTKPVCCRNNTCRLAHTMAPQSQQTALSALIFHHSSCVLRRPHIQRRAACLLPNAIVCARRVACRRRTHGAQTSPWCHHAGHVHANPPNGEVRINTGSGFTAEWDAVPSHCRAQRHYGCWVNFGGLDVKKIPT